eukprot:3939383-Rhodomonas_salina.3
MDALPEHWRAELYPAVPAAARERERERDAERPNARNNSVYEHWSPACVTQVAIESIPRRAVVHSVC